jgi:hypothetical protein
MTSTTSTSTATRERGAAAGTRVPRGARARLGQPTLAAPLPGGATPERSIEQRRTALKEANRIRSHRAVLKRRLHDGEASAAAALDDVDCASMKLVTLLRALPKIGRVKANYFLNHNAISASKTLGGLSERQRGVLLEWLP